MQKTTQFDTIDIMHIITVFRVVICFHRGYKGTIEGLESCVCHSRGKEQEQYQHIPDRIRGDYKHPFLIITITSIIVIIGIIVIIILIVMI